MKTCPFFGVCGGCKFDFSAPDYRDQKLALLRNVAPTGAPVWTPAGQRRRADFAFAGGGFGFYAARAKDIVPVRSCPNLVPEINSILSALASLPWDGAGACLVTWCDNGLDIAITSNVPYFSAGFRNAVDALPSSVIRVTWNGRAIVMRATPMVSFDGHAVPYPSGAFLQPTIASADELRRMVVAAADGAHRVADLFCGLGNFTFALNADGFDIVGTGARRDLFTHPLTVGMLRTYDCVVMDPPRAGAFAQCQEIVKSDVARVIYVSCNPQTFMRDARVLTDGGYAVRKLIPVDQFVGSAHWELFAVFEK